MKYVILSFSMITSLAVVAQEKNILKEKWHWDNKLKQDTSAGYAQVVKVDNVLYYFRSCEPGSYARGYYTRVSSP